MTHVFELVDNLYTPAYTSDEVERVVHDPNSRALYAIVDASADYLNSLRRTALTVEAVGHKFNRTLGVDAGVDLAIHADQQLDTCPGRTLEELRAYLNAHCMEGLVVMSASSGKCWKVRSNCMDKNHLYEQVKRGKAPVPDSLVYPKLLSKQYWRDTEHTNTE